MRDLARSGALTPFTRALAEGHTRAATALDQILNDRRATALDPYCRRISSVAATASAKARTHAAIGGPDGLLRSIHPSVSWDGRHLRLNTNVDAVESLEERPLIFQPSALVTRITFNPLADEVIVSYPAAAAALTRDPELHTPLQALQSLLGTTRAAALVAVVRTPALTTGQLAATSASPPQPHRGTHPSFAPPGSSPPPATAKRSTTTRPDWAWTSPTDQPPTTNQSRAPRRTEQRPAAPARPQSTRPGRLVDLHIPDAHRAARPWRNACELPQTALSAGG
ncbi:hypothetical protein ACFY1J_45120 [Streptomyces sp. NPDC001406]|uniref:hypothetical protein n=1 Tax=Streptomyces sp. NPDC001406 TaxID=3364572 RepID=UPI0036BC374C